LKAYVNRRTFITAGTAAAIASASGLIVPPPSFAKEDSDLETRRQKLLAEVEARQRRIAAGWNTHNGWPAEKLADGGGAIWTRDVPGTDVSLTVCDGEPRALLEYVVQRFHLEIRALGATDVVGFDPGAGRVGVRSNHASGTAVDILPAFYPAGGNNGMFDQELRVVRDILGGCAGLVGWGGDVKPLAQGFFYLKARPGSRELKNWSAQRDQERERLGGSVGMRPLGV
jgi:hypothetical protein